MTCPTPERIEEIRVLSGHGGELAYLLAELLAKIDAMKEENEKLKDHFENCNSGKILTLQDRLTTSEAARAKMREALVQFQGASEDQIKACKLRAEEFGQVGGVAELTRLFRVYAKAAQQVLETDSATPNAFRKELK